MSSRSEENKALVRRFIEALSTGDLETLDELLAPDFVDHSLLPGQDPGREGYLRGVTEDLAAFSDVSYIVEEQVAEGDRVVSRVTMRSTHDRGEYEGFSPTGKETEMPAIVIHRIADGKIELVVLSIPRGCFARRRSSAEPRLHPVPALSTHAAASRTASKGFRGRS